MQAHQKYSGTDKMNDIIHDNHFMLSVLCRFGISLGFGNDTVEEACSKNKIDCQTFLAVLNFLSEETFDMEERTESISVKSLIEYLRNAHSYFLEYKLPTLRTKLLEAVDMDGEFKHYSGLIVRFFDDYVSEVKKHMEYENKEVFVYVSNLIDGNKNKKYSISIFHDRHNEIDSKLNDLKNILIKYYPAKGSNYLLTEVLFDILLCEKDLTSHNQIEDYLLVPAVEQLEQKLKVVQ